MQENKTPNMVTELLKKAVAEKGQSGVARETGLTQPAIHRYLKGIGEPSTRTLKKLSDFFGVSVAELRGETAEEAFEKMYKLWPSKYNEGFKLLATLCSTLESFDRPDDSIVTIFKEILEDIESTPRELIMDKLRVRTTNGGRSFKKYLSEIKPDTPEAEGKAEVVEAAKNLLQGLRKVQEKKNI